jgi:hypothetical protein
MRKRIFRYLVHIFGTVFTLSVIGTVVLISMNGTFDFQSSDLGRTLEHDGPYVFYESDSSYSVNYIKGNKEEGFFLDSKVYPATEAVSVQCYFPLEQKTFEFSLSSNFESLKSHYNDGEKILAISDIESGFKTFRDYLMNNKVIDERLNWTFGKGHLVLLGDFVDRGMSTTQVLWFIYKLEQEAKEQGGHVHFIIGNHELYNMQGKFKSASPKYHGVAAVLGKQQHNLYDENSYLGKWLASKNTIELINGNLFTHGGIHPDFLKFEVSLEEINRIARENYRKTFYPRPGDALEQLICSSRNGLSWYRGYFNEDLTQDDVDTTLDKFGAEAVIVGHTLQSSVKSMYSGRVFAIDVKHPKDYKSSWPKKSSEGLFIKDDKYFRLLNDQQAIQL